MVAVAGRAPDNQVNIVVVAPQNRANRTSIANAVTLPP